MRDPGSNGGTPAGGNTGTAPRERPGERTTGERVSRYSEREHGDIQNLGKGVNLPLFLFRRTAGAPSPPWPPSYVLYDLALRISFIVRRSSFVVRRSSFVVLRTRPVQPSSWIRSTGTLQRPPILLFQITAPDPKNTVATGLSAPTVPFSEMATATVVLFQRKLSPK